MDMTKDSKQSHSITSSVNDENRNLSKRCWSSPSKHEAKGLCESVFTGIEHFMPCVYSEISSSHHMMAAKEILTVNQISQIGPDFWCSAPEKWWSDQVYKVILLNFKQRFSQVCAEKWAENHFQSGYTQLLFSPLLPFLLSLQKMIPRRTNGIDIWEVVRLAKGWR